MEIKTKDADAILDFKFDLAPLTNGQEGADSDYLESGETIDTISVSIDTGINLHDGVTTYNGAIKAAPAKTDTNTSVTFWLSGGTAGEKYRATLNFTTTPNGRTDQRSMIIRVVEK